MVSRQSRTCLLLILLWLAPLPPAAPFSESEAPSLERLEEAVLKEVNRVRQEHGLAPLAYDTRLARLAREHSRAMHEYEFFDHVDPQGRDVAARARAAGIEYRRIGENIAFNEGITYPIAAAVEGWLASPGHRANILNAHFQRTGVGIWRENQSYYFTQIFLTPASEEQPPER